MSDSKTGFLLLIEDDGDQAELTKEAFAETSLRDRIKIVATAEECLAYLREPTSPKPRVILLDLILPGRDGFQLINDLKLDTTLKHIPILVLTNLVNDSDVLKAYRLHVNCFIAKPENSQQMVLIAQSIDAFWFNSASLPPDSVFA